MDLIDRKELIENITGAFERHYADTNYQLIRDFYNATKRRIMSAEKVDAEPVVRCKDCKRYYEADECDVSHCRNPSCGVGDCDDEFFCQKGEREEE